MIYKTGQCPLDLKDEGRVVDYLMSRNCDERESILPILSNTKKIR